MGVWPSIVNVVYGCPLKMTKNRKPCSPTCLAFLWLIGLLGMGLSSSLTENCSRAIKGLDIAFLTNPYKIGHGRISDLNSLIDK